MDGLKKLHRRLSLNISIKKKQVKELEKAYGSQNINFVADFYLLKGMEYSLKICKEELKKLNKND